MTDDVTTSKRLSVPTNPARALRDLNRQLAPPPVKPAEDEAEDLAKNTTILQSDKPTDQQTSKQPDPPTDNPTNQPNNKPTSRPTNKPSSKPAGKAPTAETKVETEEVPRPARIDGRTMRARQPTADRTMVTSLRLAVETVEALDGYCWQHRQRKQDVVQAALDMYFAAQEGEEA